MRHRTRAVRARHEHDVDRLLEHDPFGHVHERAVLDEHKLQFSYKAGDAYHFMNTESYEMVELSGDVLGENAGYLTEGMMITAEYFEGRVVGIDPPMFVELKVTETTPNIKGPRCSRPVSRSRSRPTSKRATV